MGTTAEKLTYLNGTKTKLKDMLNLGGASLTTEPFRQYVDTLKNRYLYFMNNGTQEVWDNWEKVVGEGTTITLNNTEEAPMKIVLKGNTSQETTTGKNLFNIEGRYETGTGITYTKNDDGSYTLNGTANGNNFLRGLCYLNEQHTISYTSNTTNANVIIRTRTGTPSAQTGIQDQMTVSSTSGSLTSSKQFDFVEISIVNGTTLNNFKIYIQLEKGSSATSFEPYTNGASPNPDYPQDIHVVSGDNSIDVCGLNLLQKQGYGTPYSDSTYWVGSPNWLTSGDDGWATLSVDNSSGSSALYRNMMIKSGNAKYKPSTNYTIFVELDDLSLDNATGDMLYLSQGGNAQDPFNSGQKLITYAQAPNKVFKFNVTTKADLTNTIAFRTFAIVPAGKNVSYKIRAMIVEGNYEKNIYEPYTSASYPISLGVENLINNVLTSQTLNGLQFNVNEDKSIWIKGTATARTEPNLWTGSMVLKAGTTYYNNTDTTLYLYANAYYSIGANSSYTPTNDLTLTRIYIRVENGETINKTIYPMLSTTQTTNYCEYGKAIELCKIGDYQDSIVKDNGKWYLNKQIRKVILDGTENWETGAYGTNSYKLPAYSYGYMIEDPNRINIITNLFKGVAFVNRTTSGDNIIYNDSSYFYIRNTSYTSLANFKTMLGTNNMTLYYVLNTPTYTEITDSTLLSQLNALAKSYASQTNISQENNDLPFIINATALREMS